MKHPIIILLCSIVLASFLIAQPNKPLPKAELLKLTGKFKEASPSKDIRILWLYGPEDHKGREHDYIRIKELFVPLLKRFPAFLWTKLISFLPKPNSTRRIC